MDPRPDTDTILDATIRARKPSAKERATGPRPKAAPEPIRTRPAKAATPAKAQKPAVAKSPKLSPTGCRWGAGAYGSPPNSKRCDLPRFDFEAHPGHQLCEKHIPVWNAEAKRRALAKHPELAPKANGRRDARAHSAKVAPATRPKKVVSMHQAVARVPRVQAPEPTLTVEATK